MSWELMFMNAKKTKGDGWLPSVLAWLSIWTTARVLKMIQPPFGKMVAREAQLGLFLKFTNIFFFFF